MIFAFFYEIGLWILALFAFPKYIYDCIVKKKHRKSLFNKWGIGLPKPQKNRTPVIWIHAVSLGETKAVIALSQEIKNIFPNGQLIISSITETGHAEAKKSISRADHHIYLPFDFNFLAKKVIERFSPDLVLLSETDFWFNFLRLAKKRGAILGLVNGKISERSTNRFMKFPSFSKPLFNLFDIFCLQNAFYAERFKRIGIAPDQIHVTGNLKLDDNLQPTSSDELQIWREKLRIRPDELILTIGSTHNPEESLLIDVLRKVWKIHPDLKVLLIPRHPERYAEVGKLLENRGLSWINYTELDQSSNEAKIIVLNVMGLLHPAYQISTVSIVGGSFTPKVGGHNILEPCKYGKPVIFGPHMHTQVEFVELVKKYSCGLQMNLEELADQLPQLLSNADECKRRGSNGTGMAENLKGSTNRTLIALKPFLKKISKKSGK